MRLIPKLSIVLSSTFACTLWGLLWISYRSGQGYLEENRDSFVLAGLAAHARRCGASWGAPESEKKCLESLRFLAETVVPEAHIHSMVVDPRRRILLHSDFLSGDEFHRDVFSTEPYVHVAVSRPGPFVQRGLFTGFKRRVYSVPVPTPEGRAGTLLAVYDEKGLMGPLAWIRRDARRLLLQALLLGTSLGILLAVGVVLYFLSPLQLLFEASRDVGKGDFTRRIPCERADELGQLVSEFNRMTAQLAELEQLKDLFLGKVTHALRTPLNTMISHADLLQGGYKGSLTEEQQESVRGIAEAGKTLAGLIENILDVTRLEAGRATFEPAALDLRTEIESAVAPLKGWADELGVTMQVMLARASDQVYADAQAFRRILGSLISNAIKFTPKGGLVTVSAYRGKRNEVVCVVSDTGIGIPKERLETLFTKFSRVPETHGKVRASGGAGLGLFLSKMMVEAQGGKLWVRSELLRGSSFYFSLPERAA